MHTLVREILEYLLEDGNLLGMTMAMHNFN